MSLRARRCLFLGCGRVAAAFKAGVFTALCSVLHVTNVPLPPPCKETGDTRRALLPGPESSPRLQTFALPLRFRPHSQVLGIRACIVSGAVFQLSADGVQKPGRQAGRRWGSGLLHAQASLLAGPASPTFVEAGACPGHTAGGVGRWLGWQVCARVPLSRGFLTATSCRGSRERGLGRGSCPACSPRVALSGWGAGATSADIHGAGGGCGAGGGLGFSSGLGSSVGRLTLRRRENAGVFSSLS